MNPQNELSPPPGGRRARRAGRLLSAMLAAAIALTTTLSTTACTYVNPENRYVSKFLDNTVQPKSTAARVSLAPVFIPVGLLAYVTDFAAINPIVQLKDTTLITRDSVWDDVDLTDFIDVALLIPRIVIYTPLTWGSVYIFRIIFPFDRYEPDDGHDADEAWDGGTDQGSRAMARKEARG